ncbi:hypothetical protein FGO68_gene13272 [Halteria grandinella]|uniref:Uncharacterized protein n=1 Tax=Halteria grandinella TaxID=5974 RepID=A0A8J8SZ30_HALGN|nr:hypothetical protein FGO68_gene13272 [Halteria grandinella]
MNPLSAYEQHRLHPVYFFQAYEKKVDAPSEISSIFASSESYQPISHGKLLAGDILENKRLVTRLYE